MRRVIVFACLGFFLAGCGDTVIATPDRTEVARAVELTVGARTLPTTNPVVPTFPVTAIPAPTATMPPSKAVPIPTNVDFVYSPAVVTTDFEATHVALPTAISPPTLRLPTLTAIPTRVVPTPIPTQPPWNNIDGSWVAQSSDIHVRFFAPPSLIESPEFTHPGRYSLASPSNIYDFEALDIVRIPGARGGDYATTWNAELASFEKIKDVDVPTVTTVQSPEFQLVSRYRGNSGRFSYNQVDNGLLVYNHMWVGQVGDDEVIILYRGAEEREYVMGNEFAQIIATIDFNAQ